MSVYANYGRLEIERDRVTKARGYINALRKITSELGSKSNYALSLCLLARVSAKIGDWQKSRRNFRKVIQLCRNLKEILELRKVYYWYGEATLNKKTDARNYLELAREIFMRVGARGWLKKVETLCRRA
ncbi:MAG TPA: hypothetical protein EYP86_04275 [Candidatus Altiarchaeales archaeon]|nr:hypothetical protein [Candidatus Altiarchaeales archaeon]